LIDFVQHPDHPTWEGVGLAFLMFLTTSINSLVNNRYFLENTRGAINIKSILFPAIFAKVRMGKQMHKLFSILQTMKLSSTARKEKTSGEIVNLVAVDIDQIEDLFFDGMLLIKSPIKVVVSMVIIYQLLGTATFFGVAAMALLIPINVVMVNRQKKLQVLQESIA
jgi:ABC-type multidrug transport system fused ATPase/permease subunit